MSEIGQQYFLGAFWAMYVPVTVAINDCFAYFWGRSFGKTPLIKLSPNKTLEGFLGGAFSTFVFVYVFIGSVFSIESLMCMN